MIGRRAALATAGAFAGPASARAPAIVGSNAPPYIPWERQWQRLAENTTAAGIPVEMLTGGELGSDEGIIAALRRNRVQIGGFTLAAMANVVPEFALLTIPYYFASAAEAAYVQDATALTVFEPLLRAKGLAFLQWTNSGWAGLFTMTPVRTPDQLRGRKYRAAPAIAHRIFLEEVGADVVPLGLADLIPSLQAGTVEGGVITVSYYGPTVSETARYFTNTRHYPEAGVVAANAAWFSQLSDVEQSDLRGAFGAIDQVRAEIADAEAGFASALRAKGISIIDLEPQEHQAWIDATKPIERKLVSLIGGAAEEVLAAMDKARLAYRSGTR